MCIRDSHGAGHAGVTSVRQNLLQQGDVGFLVVDDQDAGVENFLFGNHGGVTFGLAWPALLCEWATARSSASINSWTLMGLVM